jgi:hypothetical protein
VRDDAGGQKTCDEFDCRDCGVHVFSFPAGSAVWSGQRCGNCQWWPGWHKNPELRAILDPDYKEETRQ